MKKRKNTLKFPFVNKKGASDGLIILGVIGVFSWVLSQTMGRLSSALLQKRRQQAYSYTTFSGAETMMFAYRLAHIKYLKDVAAFGCTTAKSFLTALKEGSGCKESITVFSQLDAAAFDQKDLPFSYISSGCVISSDSSSCGSGFRNLIASSFVGGNPKEIPDPNHPGLVPGYIFALHAVSPEKGILEFNADLTTPGNKSQSKTQRFSFALRTFLPNAAHLEPEGRVTQETPDPFSKCPGSSWATFLVFNSIHQGCEEFTQLGSGTGLAFYKNRFFGFRPFDGQVIDLLAATSKTSYLVSEDGTLQGEPVFVPYKKEALINVDDITLIETQVAGTEGKTSSVSGQIYFVAGLGTEAHIGTLLSDGTRQQICDLGSQGWSQAYEGIAALSFSDPLIASNSDGIKGSRLAIFFLKTSGGDYLTVSVLKFPEPQSPFICHVAKENYLQQIEYSRTNGFDRTDTKQPYYLY